MRQDHRHAFELLIDNSELVSGSILFISEFSLAFVDWLVEHGSACGPGLALNHNEVASVADSHHLLQSWAQILILLLQGILVVHDSLNLRDGCGVSVLVVPAIVPVDGVPPNQVNGVDEEGKVDELAGDLLNNMLALGKYLVEHGQQQAMCLVELAVEQDGLSDRLEADYDGFVNEGSEHVFLLESSSGALLEIDDPAHHKPQLDNKLASLSNLIQSAINYFLASFQANSMHNLRLVTIGQPQIRLEPCPEIRP